MNNEDGAIQALVESLFLEAATELLSTYQLRYDAGAAKSNSEHIGGESILSVISASGEGIKISCSLKIGVETAMSLHPDIRDQAGAQDLCAEFNNQLIGKLKNKLLSYNCRVMLGLPSLIQGNNLKKSKLQDANSTEFTFYCDAGSLLIDLQTSIHPSIEIYDTPDTALSGTVSEGTLDFF